jgi:hypothetical protein
MSNPFEQTPHIVEPSSTALGKQCPDCGELFKEGDAVVWVARTGSDPPGVDAVVVHVRCTEPRQP